MTNWATRVTVQAPKPTIQKLKGVENMADSLTDDLLDYPQTNPGDADMEGGDGEEEGNLNGSVLPFAQEGPDDLAEARTNFITYLASPIVTLLVGSGESETVLTAHQALLTKSPYFQAACLEFSNDGSVRHSMHSTPASFQFPVVRRCGPPANYNAQL